MKQNGLLSLLFAVLLLSIALSCTDHFPPDPLPNHQRIKSITQILPGDDEDTFVSDFTYHSENKLRYIDSHPILPVIPGVPSGMTAHTSYGYNDENHITGAQRTLAPFVGEVYTYDIDPTGLNRQLSNFNSGSNTYFMFFTYNGNQLESSRRTFKTSGISYEQKIMYFFAGNNLDNVDYETTLERNTTTVTKSKSEFTYDDKVNPFYGMPVIPASNVGLPSPSTGNFSHYTFAGGFESFMHLSRNNVLSEKSSTLSETTYSYTYNNDGLPLTRITMKKNTPQDQPQLVETLVFEYETF